MSKGLEELEKLQKEDLEKDNLHLNRQCGYLVIKKELKVLEIIITKKVNVGYFMDGCSHIPYGLYEALVPSGCASFEELTEEEYELLKEVLQ